MLREQEIAREEAAKARERYHEQKMRQQIRENNQELRILESKLRTAYVSKALTAQKREREALQLAEKLQKKEESSELEKSRISHLEDLKRQHEIDQERKKKLHEDLTQQIVSAHQKNQKLYEEFLREKYYLDEIAQRLKEELLEQAQKKIEMREQTKKEMEAFKIIKKELERVEQIETDEENQRIVEYCQQRDKKIEEEEKRARELESNRKNLNEKMVAELSELIVSLFTFNFVGECDQEGVDMFAIRKTWSKTLEHHPVVEHRCAEILIRDNSVFVDVHLLDDYVNQVLNCFVNVFLLMLVNELPHQVYHFFTTNFVLASGVIYFEAIVDLLLKRAAEKERHR